MARARVERKPWTRRILYEQMVGRGLRGPGMGRTTHCEIVDLIDNFDMFPEPQAYEAFWKDWAPSGPTFRQGDLARVQP
jgi:superfamily II DNA or RNA helicase